MSIRAKLSAAIVRLVDEAFDELQDEFTKGQKRSTKYTARGR